MAGRRAFMGRWSARGFVALGLMVVVVGAGVAPVAAAAPLSTITATATCGADALWHVTWTLRDIDPQSLVPVIELVPTTGTTITPAFTPPTVAPTRSSSANVTLPSGWKGVIHQTVTVVG